MKWWRNLYTVELHLSGLIGTVSHPDTQKLQIIGTFFEEATSTSLKWEKSFYKWWFRLHIYVHTNKTQVHNI